MRVHSKTLYDKELPEKKRVACELIDSITSKEIDITDAAMLEIALELSIQFGRGFGDNNLSTNIYDILIEYGADNNFDLLVDRLKIERAKLN
jgi:hypothetical protein